MPKVLPTECEFSHAFAFELHDALVHVVKEGEAREAFWYELELKCPSDGALADRLAGEELWDWLETHGYSESLTEVAFRQLVRVLITDFCHFVYEALQCSAKGKLTVAYALLRKPLRDDLFLLEWLLADRAGFLGDFGDDVHRLDPGKVSPDRRKTIIGEAMAKTEMGHWIEPQFIHDLRYDQLAPFGLAPVWNQALHIVTSHKAYRTETGNLNFVFSGEEDVRSQWENLYLILPFLLLHAVHIVEALVDDFAPEMKPSTRMGPLRRTIGFLLWTEQVGHTKRLGAAEAVMRDLLGNDAIRCPQCNNPIGIDGDNLRKLYETGTVACDKCNLTSCFEW